MESSITVDEEKKRDNAKRAFELVAGMDGRIDTSEVESVLTQLSKSTGQDLKITESEMKSALKAMDPRGEGRIQFEDFYSWFASSRRTTSSGGVRSYGSTGSQPYSAPPRAGSTSGMPPAYPRSSSSSGGMGVPHSGSSSHMSPSTLDRVRSNLPQDTILDQLFQAGGVSGTKETYFCEICFSYESLDKGFALRTCGHRFCKDCIEGYFKSKVTDGQVYLNCFATNKFDEKSIACEVKIAEDDIIRNLDGETIEKYRRFKENLENPHTRECRKCKNTQQGDPKNPNIKCTQCGWEYCFTHGDQHSGSSCAEYERTHRRENLINQMLIAKITKPCPKCQSNIQKRSGCNHMKCPQCHCSFCWLCLQEVEDKPIPEHFKDTNTTSGCRGKQFTNQPVAPTGVRGCLAVLLGIILFIVLTPPSLALALVTYVVGLPCLVMYACGQGKGCSFFANVFTVLLRFWMVFLLYVLVFFLTLAFFPLVCLICCCRGAGVIGGGDEDDLMARQLEAEAEREAAAQLARERKVDEIV